MRSARRDDGGSTSRVVASTLVRRGVACGAAAALTSALVGGWSLGLRPTSAQDRRAPAPERLECRYPAGQKLTWDMSLAFRARVAGSETFRMDQHSTVTETVIPSAESQPHRVLWQRGAFQMRFFDGERTFTYEDDGKDATATRADFVAASQLAGPVERSYEYELARGSLKCVKVDKLSWICDVKLDGAPAAAHAADLQRVQERGAQRFQGRPAAIGSSWSVDEDDEDLGLGWTLKRQTTYTVVAREVFDGRPCLRLSATQQGKVMGSGDPCEVSKVSCRGETLFDLVLGNVVRESLRSDAVLKRVQQTPRPHVFEDERTLDFRLVLLPRPSAVPASGAGAPAKGTATQPGKGPGPKKPQGDERPDDGD